MGTLRLPAHLRIDFQLMLVVSSDRAGA